MAAERGARYEPLPRWGHVTVSLDGKVFMWGGRTEDFSEAQQKKLACTVEVFDCRTETWVSNSTRGTPPKGLYNSAHTLQGTTLYVYGGWDGQKAHNSLHQLDLATFEWSRIKMENPEEAPTEMSGCGLVACGNKKLVLFGGYGLIKEKKKEEKKKSKVEKRYALVTVEEEAVGEDKSHNGQVTEKVQLEESKGEREAVSLIAADGAADGAAAAAADDDGGEKREVTENGLMQSVMAEIEERGANEDKNKADSAKSKENSTHGEVEEGESKEGEESGLVEENGTTEVEGSIGGAGNVKEVDVVNEHVSVKSQKAVVIKLPVSFDLAATESTETGAEPSTSSGDRENEPTILEGQQNSETKQSGADPTHAEESREEEMAEEEMAEDSDTTFSIYKQSESDAKGWTNEVKIFDLDTRLWSSQPTSGSLPPPCVDFSFTSPDKKKAVVFGGYQPPDGITNDTFLLDMETWVWRKLSGESSDVTSPSRPTPSLLQHPSARDGHSACVIEGAPHPAVLITGGWDASDHALSDLWFLDITSGLWKQIPGGKEMGNRFWHTTVMSQFSSRMRQLLTFGGCPGAPESHTTGSWPKIADTVILELGKTPSLQFAGDTEERWTVIDSVREDNMGDPMRRLRETALLTSFRAQRAENLLRSMFKKITSLGGVATPQRKTRSLMPTPIPPEIERKKEVVKRKKVEIEEEPEQVKRPFWQKSMEEIQMTYEELGRGRFSIVKVAIFHETKVAARCMFTRVQSDEDREVLVECLEMAAQLRHPNLVSFMGAIIDREPVIITELMACNLRSLLEKRALTYYQLVDVTEGVSKALQYLHSVKPHPVVHGELTATSVLLDSDKGPRLKAKLSDYMTAKYFHHMLTSVTPAASIEDVFAHSREHPSQEYKSRVARRSSSRSRSGSPLDSGRTLSPERPAARAVQFRKPSTISGGPPDVAEFSTKRDVYLFGILLVEISTRTAVLEVSLQYLLESISWVHVAGLARRCLTLDPQTRPDMTTVVAQVMQLASSKP